MSYVSNVIVCWAISEPDDQLERVNEVLVERCGVLKQVGESGGDKNFEVFIAVGAFNSFPRDEFCDHLASLPWQLPSDVQVFIHGQDDERFHECELELPWRP